MTTRYDGVRKPATRVKLSLVAAETERGGGTGRIDILAAAALPFELP
jgi:hypothetical protein